MKISGSTAWFRSPPAAFLRVCGPDALGFLQGQFSNDLRPLRPGNSVYGLWLTVKGKVLADSTIIQAGAEDFWIYSAHSAAAVIKQRLEDFIIADDVTVEDASAAWDGVILVGLTPAEAAPPPLADGFLIRARITPADSFAWIYPRARWPEVEAVVAAGRSATANELELRRIDAGLAAVPADIGPNDLPNEGGLEVVAVSYDKGCYLGQEVMARLKGRGRVRRQLQRVLGTGAIPPLPATLFHEGKKAGELRSASALAAGGYAGLALLGAGLFDPDRPLSLAADLPGEIRIGAAVGK